MGYCMEQKECHFRVDAKNVPTVQEILNTHPRGNIWELSVAKVSEIADTARLEPLQRIHEGDGIFIDFKGDKLVNDDVLLALLAPYVSDGCYIEMEGEDNLRWRWTFNGGKCLEVTAEIDWNGHCEAFRALLEKKEILPVLMGIHPVLDAEIEKRLK